jgi:hypothetical protein
VNGKGKTVAKVLTIKIEDEHLAERVKQRAHNLSLSVSDIVITLLGQALNDVEEPPEPPHVRKLDETTLRCLEALKSVGIRLEAAEPTYGLLSFGDERGRSYEQPDAHRGLSDRGGIACRAVR